MPDLPPKLEDRFGPLRAQIAARLKPLCENWPEERFNVLVDSIAAITLKYEDGEPLGVYDRRATDLLIDDLKELTRRVEEHRDRE